MNKNSNGRQVMLVVLPLLVLLLAAGGMGYYTQNSFGSILGSWMVAIAVFGAGALIMLAIGKFQQPGSRTTALALLGLLVIPLGLFIFFFARPWLAMRPFNSRLDEYRTAAKTTDRSSSPYTRGKIIPVDAKKDRIDAAVMLSLPDDLRPSDPDEVGTIAWEECDTYAVGSYGGKGTAYEWQCKVTVVDSKDKLATAQSNTIHGSSPPSTSKNGSSQTGSRPTQAIVDYLKSLPRK